MIVRTLHIRHPQIWVLQPWLLLALQAMLPLAWFSAHWAESHARLWQPIDTKTLAITWLGMGMLGALIWLMKSIRMCAMLLTKASSGPTLYPFVAFLSAAWLAIAPSRVAINVSESINRSLRSRQDLIEDARVLGFLFDARDFKQSEFHQIHPISKIVIDKNSELITEPDFSLFDNRLFICERLREEPARFEAAARRYVPPSEIPFVVREIKANIESCKQGRPHTDTITSEYDVRMRLQSRFRDIAISHDLVHSHISIEKHHEFWIVGLIAALLLVTIFVLWASFGIWVVSRMVLLTIILGLLGQHLTNEMFFIDSLSMRNPASLIVITEFAFGLLTFAYKTRSEIVDRLIVICLSIPCILCVAITPLQGLQTQLNSSHPSWNNVLQIIDCWIVGLPLIGYGLTRYARKLRRN